MENKDTYRVPEANLETLRERIAKLNKRAAKLNSGGAGAIELTIKGYEDVTEKRRARYALDDSEMEDTIVRYYTVAVSGPAPKINGWQFIAVIQPVADENGNSLGNVIRAVPPVENVPVQYRNATSACEHCNTARRRNETFVLRHEDGTTKQVGRNCLRDFLGHTNPETYAEIAELVISAHDLAGLAEDSDGPDGRGGRVIERFLAEEILQLAASSIRQTGWVSRATQRDTGAESTSSTVSAWLNARSKDRKEWKHPLTITDEDRSLAAEVVEWLKSLVNRTDLNDYTYNLSLLGMGATVEMKNFGLVCSSVPAFMREKEREINRRKRFAEDANSQYVGTVGERTVFTVTLVSRIELPNDFGVTYLHKFRDDAGNVLVWFGSNPLGTGNSDENAWKETAIGETVTVKATVKKHEEYKGIKQTIISRVAEHITKEEKKRRKEVAAAQREINTNYETRAYAV